MADLEQRVENLENKVRELEININKSLNEIKISLTEIIASLKSNTDNGDLKNSLIEKDIQTNNIKIEMNTKKIEQLENNQSKIVWTIILAVIGVIGDAVYRYIQLKP